MIYTDGHFQNHKLLISCSSKEKKLLIAIVLKKKRLSVTSQSHLEIMNSQELQNIAHLESLKHL